MLVVSRGEGRGSETGEGVIVKLYLTNPPRICILRLEERGVDGRVERVEGEEGSRVEVKMF